MKNILIILILVTVGISLRGQSIKFEKAAFSDTISLAKDMQNLANDYLQQNQVKGLKTGPNNLYMLEILAGKYARAITTIQSTRDGVSPQKGPPDKLPYELFTKAKIAQSDEQIPFETAYRKVLSDYLRNCSDAQLNSINIELTTYDQVAQFTNQFKENYKRISGPEITLEEALTLLRSYFFYKVFHLTEPVVFREIRREQNRRYQIEQKLIVSPIDSAEISVTVVSKRGSGPLPAILTFTIYADQSNINQALIPASKGYVGVLAYSRGKGLSNNAIEPYKHEHNDVYAVIDWISKQFWNNGKVGMFGGSYNGFAQWASMKDSVPPALKTIVPCVSAAPGIDVPMENNIFYNFSYKWISYVTENNYLYHTDFQKWNNLQNKWFHSGAPYDKMDSIDGTPNPLFHEWISHPGYDRYWQSMIPYKDEFAHIDIPILTITGYYDDGQRGAMYYYNQHLKYNPDAAHYLLIGPWDHWGAQSTPGANLRGYQLDEAAQIDIQNQLIFDWFDYVLKGKEKPEILKDKVNFEVMGKNKWLHTPALADMSNDSLVYYLSANKSGDMYQLATKANKDQEALKLIINLADRSNTNNADYYPWPIMKDSVNLQDGLMFETDPFEKEVVMNGSFTGKLELSTNKKDFDYTINLYELTPEGTYFHLSYYIGRASYSKSKEKRELLIPDKETTITFDNTRIVSKKISKGSRLVVIVNGNKNQYAQINYGTGRDVSNESVKDATIPLELKLSTTSKIVIPILNNAKDQNPENIAAMLDTIWRTEQEPIRLRDSIGKVYGYESEAFQKQNEIYHRNHDINERKILRILDTYGWPDREMTGNHGNLTICNVIQHSDNEVRLKYLPMMRQAVEDNKLEPRFLGRSEDRIATERGELQFYGTQVKYYPETKTFDVWPVYDPVNVNKRRAEIGLEPIEEFLKNRFNLEWDLDKQIIRSEEFENK